MLVNTTKDGSARGDAPQGDERRLRLVFGTARQFGPDVTVAVVSSFVEIALAGPEGMGIGKLGERLGLSQSSASRNIAQLTWQSWTKKPGYDVVTVMTDPHDSRAKLARLNAKGRRVWASMLRSLEV